MTSEQTNTRRRTFDVANAIMAILFIASVAVQFNDPDPWRWAALYGASATACVLAAAHRLHWIFAAVVCAVATLWLVTLLPAVFAALGTTDLLAGMDVEEGVEEIREAGGLVIVAVWTLVLALAARRI